MKQLRLTIAALFLISPFAANADVISDFNKASAAGDGWSIVYQGGYGVGFDYAGILNAIASGSRVALASSSSDGAANFDLFAATSLDILQMITAINTTIMADGAYWYRNSSSTGFASASHIMQQSADTIGAAGFSTPNDPTGDFRLSWHGGLTSTAGGWRSGENIWLNSDNTWQRYVLVSQVPEPGTLALLGLGLFGLGMSRRKKV